MPQQAGKTCQDVLNQQRRQKRGNNQQQYQQQYQQPFQQQYQQPQQQQQQQFGGYAMPQQPMYGMQPPMSGYGFGM